MNTSDFIHLGVPLGEAVRQANDFIRRFILGRGDKSRSGEEVKAVLANPSAFAKDSPRGRFAKAMPKVSPAPRREPKRRQP